MHACHVTLYVLSQSMSCYTRCRPFSPTAGERTNVVYKAKRPSDRTLHTHAYRCQRSLGCPPQASNVATYIAHGDVALSVLMTTASTVGAIFMTPLLTKLLAGALVPVDAAVSCSQQLVQGCWVVSQLSESVALCSSAWRCTTWASWSPAGRATAGSSADCQCSCHAHDHREGRHS